MMENGMKPNVPQTKRGTLMAVILLCWAASVLYFNPRLLALLIGDEPGCAKFSLVVFVATLDLLWLNGIYHLVHIGFSLFAKDGDSGHVPVSKPQNELSPVAVLYLTRNDFNPGALETCLRLDYPDFHVFLCDDSDHPGIRKDIRRFTKEHARDVTLFRRKNKTGYKAGNINHALSKIDFRYSYVLVTDADSELPRDFLKKILPRFTDPNIAFVQALQRPGTLSKTPFAADMDYLIDLHHRHYAVNKNRYGHAMWYGHGAVLKREAVERLGGIPEVVTEDLAFSSEIRRLGYRGVVTPDISSGEASPENALRFRRRNRKWVRGTLEYLFRFYPRLLRCKKVPWFEKADILVSAVSLLFSLPFVLFLLTASFVIPGFYALERLNGPFFLVPPVLYDNAFSLVLKTRYNVFWAWDFYVIMALTIFAPLLPAFWELRRDVRKMVRFLCMATFINLSLVFDSAKEMAGYLVTRRNRFPVTGDVSFRNEKPLFVVFEVFLGAVVSYYAFKTYNLWLLAVSFAMMATPVWIVFKDRKAVRWVTSIPFAVTSTVTLMIGITLLQESLMK